MRIGIGQNEGQSVYRVAEVLEACETPKIYAIGKTRTNKGLKLRHADQERVFRIEFVSNYDFTDEEFIKWQSKMTELTFSLPTTRDIEMKEKQIRDATNRKLSDNEITVMLKQKEKFSLNPTNYAMAKSKIKKEIDNAKAVGDEKLVESLSSKLITLEERAEELDKRRNEKISTIALINDKNRKKNIERAELGIKQEMERIKKEGVVSDPFTRRKTQPVLPTHVIKKKEAALRNGSQASNKDGIPEPEVSSTRE